MTFTDLDGRVVEPPLGAPTLSLPTSSPGRLHRRARARLVSLVVVDLVGVVIGLTVAGLPWVMADEPGRGRLSMLTPVRTELPYVPLFLLALAAYGLYRRELRRLRHDWFVDATRLFHAAAAGSIAVMLVSAALNRTSLQWRAVHPLEAVVVTCSVFVVVGSGRSLRAVYLAQRGVLRARVAIVGAGPVAQRVAASLGAFDDVRLLGFIEDGELGAGRQWLGQVEEMDEICRVHAIDTLVIAVGDVRTPAVVEGLRGLDPTVRIAVVPRLYELITPRSTLEEVHGVNLIDIAPPSLSVVQLFLKRTIDVVGSLLLLVLGAPVMVACAIAVRVTSRGPALFKQRRIGRHAEPFTVLKFRTMRCGGLPSLFTEAPLGNDADGPLFKLKDDPRVTRVGRFLRATSLDELPQLLNVLVGHMSLVGPRPFVASEAEEIDGWAAKRFTVRPGMTGLWQVSGRSDLPFEDLRQLDYAYVASWSLWWDLRILAKTPSAVFARRGAY